MNRCWVAGVFAVVLSACGGGSGTGGASSPAPIAGGAGPSDASATRASIDASALYGSLRQGGKLILHQRGALAITPEHLRARVGPMEAALGAFDGAFLRLPRTTDAVMKNVPLDPALVEADLAPLAGLQTARLRHHFALVTAQRDLDAFDDWSVVLRNVSLLARAVRAAGLVGIVIDNEDPQGSRVAYPADARFAATVTLASYQAQTQQAAKRMMEAITAEFPDVAVVVLRGPAAAEPQTPPQLAVKDLENAKMLGSFFAGIVEGKGRRALAVDGGSDYGLRTDEQFAASKMWRKSGIAADGVNSAAVAAALRPSWPEGVSASFGVRENDGARGDHMPNRRDLWESTVASALRQADAFAWASFDGTDMTLVDPSHAWAVAARRAKAAGLDSSVRLASTAAATGTGLMAQYFSRIDHTELAQTLVDGVVDHDFDESGYTLSNYPQSADYSILWTGELEAEVSGPHTLHATTDDGMRITLGGVRVIGTDADMAYRHQGATEYRATVNLQAGVRYPIKIEFFQGGGPGRARVEWEAPGLSRAVLPSSRLYPVR